MYDFREKSVDLKITDKYIDFIYNQYCVATINNVEHIKEELMSFKTKPKNIWYVSFFFNDWCFGRKYEMEHSTDYNSKYKSFRRVADKAMKKLNVDLNELIGKKFKVTIATTYRLDKMGNKYEVFNQITNMQLLDETTEDNH